METIVVEIGNDKVIFKKYPHSCTFKSTTLKSNNSPHFGHTHIELIKNIIAGHINKGVDVTTKEYGEGLYLGLGWYFYHQEH